MSRKPAGAVIRAERRDDSFEIREVVRVAFEGMPYAAGDEADLVDALREDGALSVSLVAELSGGIVGQIAFSPARTSDDAPGWYALGPVSVLPQHQASGIGAELVRAGLEAIAALGGVGCILTGNPAYYTRFGFSVEPSNAPPGEPPEFFMLKLLSGVRPRGAIFFHPAFHDAASDT